MADSDAITALRDLVQSEGWQLLIAYIDHEWGPRGYGHRMQEAIAKVPHGPDRPYELARIAEQVDATAQAVNGFVTWPERRIAELSGSPRKMGPLDHLRRIAR